MGTLRISFVFLFLWSIAVPSIQADESSLQNELNAMRVSMEAMQVKMAELEKRLEVEKEGHGAVAQTKQWTPEIGVIVDTLVTLDSAKTDGEGADALQVRELELVLGSAVDPYSRLDATIAFSTSEDEPVSLEEAYLTRFGLPFDSTARVGKFKPKVGKVLTLHRDSLDTVDQPLVIKRYFGDEGLTKTGVDISKTLDLPIPIVQQFTLGILDGGNVEEEGVFGGPKRRPIPYGRLKNYIDITESTGFELGSSYMTGSRDDDSSFEVQVLAADVTLTHGFNATQNMKLQGEVFSVGRKESVVMEDVDDGMGGAVSVERNLDGDIWGAYGLLDFRVHQSWSVGGRYDIAQPIAVDLPIDGARKDERAYTGYVTFHQSEFARWRAQFTHTDLTTGKDDNAVYLQGTFAIGEHKHKIQ